MTCSWKFLDPIFCWKAHQSCAYIAIAMELRTKQLLKP